MDPRAQHDGLPEITGTTTQGLIMCSLEAPVDLAERLVEQQGAVACRVASVMGGSASASQCDADSTGGSSNFPRY